MDVRLCCAVSREATHGSTASTTVPLQLAAAPAVLLQPGFLLSVLANAFSDIEPRTIITAGYGPCAWPQHARGLYGQAGRDLQLGPWVYGDDRDLYVAQADESVPIPNHPSDAPANLESQAHQERTASAGRVWKYGRRKALRVRTQSCDEPRAWGRTVSPFQRTSRQGQAVRLVLAWRKRSPHKKTLTQLVNRLSLNL